MRVMFIDDEAGEYAFHHLVLEVDLLFLDPQHVGKVGNHIQVFHGE